MTAPSVEAMRVYDAMAALEATHDGWPVPLRLVTREAGLAAKSTAHAHLDALVRVGLIEKSPFPGGGYRTTNRNGGRP